jgi:hypothetical protein
MIMREIETSIGRVGLRSWDEYSLPGTEAMGATCDRTGLKAVFLIKGGVNLDDVSIEEVEAIIAAMPHGRRLELAEVIAEIGGCHD